MAIDAAECDAAEAVLPAVRRSSSDGLPWQSVLARTYLEHRDADEFTTLPTPNLLIVLVTGGMYSIKSRNRTRWHEVVYRPGSVGITAPGNASTLRWSALGTAPLTSLHLYLDAGLFGGDDGDRASDTTMQRMPDALAADDPTVATVSAALAWAMESNASALYADSAAHFLAAHLIERTPRSGPPAGGTGLGDRALRNVVDFMHAHLADGIGLDDLSSVAGLSKHHFLRSFKQSTGVTPHRFLTEMRMRRAAEMLRLTSRSVSSVGARCGYRSGSHFAAAFRQFHGCSPVAFRDAHRGR